MTFCTNYSKPSYGFTMGTAIILNRKGGHTKVDCHVNYANCDRFAVLITLQIFILSAVQAFQTSSGISTRIGINVIFMTHCYFFTHNRWILYFQLTI